MVGAIFGAIAQSYGDSARQNMELKAQLYARSEQQKADTRGPISTIFNSINLPKDVDKEDFIEAAEYKPFYCYMARYCRSGCYRWTKPRWYFYSSSKRKWYCWNETR